MNGKEEARPAELEPATYGFEACERNS